ncbi:alpha/beta fold hydrolase [Jiangella alkaliphila]|uniref:Pimeloyl-ACP methyl ester carboxylesterase n=1 Tax=Jiangella alkaliphila TaxID=419479 RepID=A0A1H2I2B9_9ACTN|nr:alpha/beta hydrolase [Jiangella alkaliphila]SDU38317.1 Pimeloyl-ACP methyl ester carboxylesterase [Jiangella alkaliphila]
MTSTVTSADGTTIAYTKVGSGPPLVLVDGAMCYRDSGPMADLAKGLAAAFTVYYYDRRGRGESTDTAPYAVEREAEDLEALITAAGGDVFVYGCSSGVALALETAKRPGSGIRKLALYELPAVTDDTGKHWEPDLLAHTDELIAADRRGDTVKLFMKTVGVPGFVVAIMRYTKVWKTLTGVAHTIPYDFRVLGDTGYGKPFPADRWSAVTQPALVMDGGKSPEYMRNSQRRLAEVLPNARYRTLPGQTHMVKAAAQVPVLTEYFSG